MTAPLATGPLSDLLVLDLSRVLSGPYCSMYLADFGARVVKIERPPKGEGEGAGDDTRAFGPPFIGGESTYFLSVNRNKESVAIDMKAPDGRRLIADLARRADILLENFRPGALDRLGLSYQTLRRENERLIYCSISGFGTDIHRGDLRPAERNPFVTRPGYDVVIQGMGGFMALTGEPDRPPLKSGLSIADLCSGLLAFSGILLALHARHRTGRGQHVDVSMLDGQVALLTYHAGMYLNAGREPRRMGNRHPSIAPYETYETADGFINIAAANDSLWRALCRVLGELALAPAGLADDPRFTSNSLRVQHREALGAVLEPLVRRLPSQRWLSTLEAAGIPCGPILTVPEVLHHPQVRHREMVVEVPHPSLAATGGPASIQVTGVPIKLSETPGQVRSAPPLLGEHTESALTELLGLSSDTMRDLAQRGVIAPANRPTP